MPMKYSDREKREWLKSYESGMSDKEIAVKLDCDVRTVRSGIQEARLALEAHLAREKLLWEAVQEHQKTLRGLVDKTLLALVMPYDTLDVRDKGGGKMTEIQLRFSKAEVRSYNPIVVAVVLDAETMSKTEWGLLQEHIKRDPMWKALDQWKTAVEAMIKARIALQMRAVALLEERTGCKLVSQWSRPPELSHEDLPPLIYQTALNRIIGVPEGANLEDILVPHADSGEITRGTAGPVLARLPVREVKALQECRNSVLKTIDILRKSRQATLVGDTHRALDELIPKVRATVEEVKLMNMIPNQCRICRRLGM